MLPVLLQTDSFTASPCIDCDIPGYVVLIANDKAGSLAELSGQTLGALGTTLARLEVAIKQVTSAEHVYILRFSESLASVHFHLFPRTVELGNNWLSSARPPDRDLNGPYLFGWARIRYHVDSPESLSAKTLKSANLIKSILQHTS